MEVVPEAQLEARAAEVGWAVEGGELLKVVERGDFAGALAYVNDVGALAEAAGHHPDIELHWDTVTLRLSTHSLGHVTDADLDLARRISELDVRR